MENRRPERSLVAAALVCLLAGSTARAEQGVPPGELETLKRMVEEVIAQNAELRRRVRELEAARTKQEPAVKDAGNEPAPKASAEPAQEPKEAQEPAKAPTGWWDKIQLGGAVEVETRRLRNKDFTGKSESVFELKTAEFDFEANLVDWAKAKLAFEWKTPAVAGSTTATDDKLTLNEAYIAFGTDTFPLYLKLTRAVVPFGLSSGGTVAARLEDKLTLSDPLSLAVFDTKEDHVLLGVKIGGFSAGAYVFTGDTQRGAHHRLEHYGASVGYGMKADPVSLVVGLSMIDSVFDADGLQDKFPEALTSRYVPGIAAHLRLGLFGFSLVTTYYAALREVHFTKNDTPVRIQPEAWSIEVGYTRDMFGYKTYGAVSYSQTAELANAFPEARTIATVGTWLSNSIRLAFDYVYDEDYPRRVHPAQATLLVNDVPRAGGTGKTADSYLLRLTYEW